jgi:hypothetical protein
VASLAVCIFVAAGGLVFVGDELGEVPSEVDSKLLSRRKVDSNWDGLVSDRRVRKGLSVSGANEIPMLHMTSAPGSSLQQGSALRQQLRLLIGRLKGSHRDQGGRGRVQSVKEGRVTSLDSEGENYADPYSNPYHTEPYDQAMEQRKWNALAQEFREQHPDMDPATAQKQMDALWRQRHTYYYHAYGPKTRPSPPPSPPPPSVVYPPGPVHRHSALPYPTVLAPPPEQPDFNGQSAVIAHLPNAWRGPSQLDEYQKEARGSFAVRVYGASGQPEIEISRMGGGRHDGPLGYRCTYRAYRRLQGDHGSYTIMTGFKRAWHGTGAEPVVSGMSISPTGVASQPETLHPKS